MRIKKQASYLTPEGQYSGTIATVELIQDRKNGRVRESIRITMSVDPNDSLYNYMARADFYETQANEFIALAKRVLGSDETPLTDIHGDILPDRLSLLKGKRVIFTVTHEQRPGHEHAYRRVKHLRPERDI